MEGVLLLAEPTSSFLFLPNLSPGFPTLPLLHMEITINLRQSDDGDGSAGVQDSMCEPSPLTQLGLRGNLQTMLGKRFPSTCEQWSMRHWKVEPWLKGNQLSGGADMNGGPRKESELSLMSLEPLVLMYLFPLCVWTPDFGKWYVPSMFSLHPLEFYAGFAITCSTKRLDWINLLCSRHNAKHWGCSQLVRGRGSQWADDYLESLVQWAQWVLKAMEDLTWPWGLERASQGDSTLAPIWRMESRNLLWKRRYTVSLWCAQIKISKSSSQQAME